MCRVLVFFALAALAAVEGGYLHGGSVAVAVPSAVSQQSRHDIINPGAITVTSAHAVPVVTAHAVPVAAPALRVSSAATSSVDIRRPVVAAVAAPVAAVGYGIGAGGLGGGNGGLGGLGGIGLGHAGGLGLGVGLGGHGY